MYRQLSLLVVVVPAVLCSCREVRIDEAKFSCRSDNDCPENMQCCGELCIATDSICDQGLDSGPTDQRAADRASGGDREHVDSSTVPDTVAADSHGGLELDTDAAAAADSGQASDASSALDAGPGDTSAEADNASTDTSTAPDAEDLDTSPVDAGLTCTTIAELRAMADGPVNVNLCPAYVTYMRVNGFYVQAVKEGPAIWVFTAAIDPVNLSLAIGNQITIQVTELSTYQGQKEILWNGASVILSNDGQSYDVASHLAQDLSLGTGTAPGADLDSELVSLTHATVVGRGAGTIVITYGSGGLTAELFLATGSLCTGAVFDLVAGCVGVVDTTYSIRSYVASDIVNIDNSGCAPSAVVRLNEINAMVEIGCDLVELRVVAGGTVEGFAFKERTTSVLTFPSMVVSANDYIVLHFNGAHEQCNPGTAASETLSVTDQPQATYAANYDTAFDIYVTDIGLFSGDNVLTLLDSSGTIVDAILLSSGSTTVTSPSEAQAEVVRAAGEWLRADGSAATLNQFVGAEFTAQAVLNLAATGSTAAGDTIQRLDDSDTNKRGDWTSTAAPQTWGRNNAGQSNL